MKFNKIFINSICAAALLLAAVFGIQARPGDLDKTYGNGGIVSTSFANLQETYVGDTALQSDGKLVVVGAGKYSGGSNEGFVARYNSDGSIDTTFGTNGVVMMRFPTQPNIIDDTSFNSVAIQPDGKIIVGGLTFSNSTDLNNIYDDVVIVRLNANGSLDTSFGAGGKVLTLTGTATGFYVYGNSKIYSLTIAPDGSFYAVGGGTFYYPNEDRFSFTPVLIHYSSSGAVLQLARPVFALTVNGGGANYAFNAAIQPNGKLIFANGGSSQSVTKFIVARVNADLSPDTTFGTNGVVMTDFGTQIAQVGGILIDPNGKIVVSGNSASGNGTGDFYAARYDTNGSLDTSFGTGGKVVVSFSSSPIPNADKEGQRIVRQPDGKYISAFGARFGNFGAICLLPSGALDPTFGYGGIAHYQSGNSPYPNIDGYGAFINLQADGKILLPGTLGNVFGFNGIKILRLTNYARNDRADFDDDGKLDFSVVRSSGNTLIWYYQQTSNAQSSSVGFGVAGDKIAAADFDGDGKTDIAVFRPSNGTWYILRSRFGFINVQFGASGDVPVPGDFDGDGKADICVFRPSNGTWYYLRSTDGNFSYQQFGINNDIPVKGDFDRDGKADLAVFRPSNSTWYILQSSDGGFRATQFGANGDVPISADFDGDAGADIAVFRPSNGTWYYLRSSDGAFAGIQFGANGDVPIAGDYDSDGKADIAIFRQGVWYVLRSLNNQTTIVQYGTSGDTPVPITYQP